MGRPKLELPAKQCANCKAMFERRDGEDAPNYRRRKTCCMQCRDELLSSSKSGTTYVVSATTKAKRASPRRLVVPDRRTCAECGAEFTRNLNETAAQYLKRLTCSHECARRCTGKKTSKHSRETSKACRNCGVTFFREPGISPAAFARRRVCSPECHQASFRLATTPSDLERSCAVCGLKLERRPNESTREFLERLTCGGACRQRMRVANVQKLIDYHGVSLSVAEVAEIEGKTKTTIQRAVNGGKIPGVRWSEASLTKRPRGKYSGPLTKICVVCGEPFSRTAKNSWHFAVQTICSNACNGALNRLEAVPDRRCPACDELLVRRPLEPNVDFVKRRTCNRACTLRLKKRNAVSQQEICGSEDGSCLEEVAVPGEHDGR